MNDPTQSYAVHECPIALQSVLLPITPPIQSNHPKLLSKWLQVCIVFKRGLHGGSTPVIALTAASCSPTLHSSPLSIMYFNVYIYGCDSTMRSTRRCIQLLQCMQSCWDVYNVEAQLPRHVGVPEECFLKSLPEVAILYVHIAG